MKKTDCNAYFTLVRNDSWVIGALVLGYSLRLAKADASLVCEIGEEVSDESVLLLETVYDKVDVAEEFEFPSSEFNNESDIPEHLRFSFSRLNAWKNSDYRRITYLDSDMIILRNIDHLFDMPGVVAPREYDFKVWNRRNVYTDFFNGGFVTFTPSDDLYNKFLHILKSQWVYLGASEQHLVNVVCMDDWVRLPDKYHVQAGVRSNVSYAQDLSQVYSIHFSKICKPWDSIYTGSKLLWNSWRKYANVWINILRKYEKEHGNVISPVKFGWQDSDFQQKAKYFRSSKATNLSRKYAYRGTRLSMSSLKLAEVAIQKGAFQKMSELNDLIKMLRRRKLRRVLEIGTYKGGTMWLWCQLAESDADIISIDLPAKNDLERNRDNYLYSLGIDKQRLLLVRGDSGKKYTKNKLLKVLGNQKIDFLFIDGDHRYQSVKSDFEKYSSLVRKGGIIGFHDILDHPRFPDNQVSRYWREIRMEYNFSELVDLNDDRGWGQWGGIGIIYL